MTIKSKNQTKMKKWRAVDACGNKPINRIIISGTEIIDINLNSGWEITNIKFNDMVSANHIDKLIVTFEKKKGDKSEI